MLKSLFNILIVFLLMGCGGSIKQSWTNFRAHYNTYYNAEKSFRAGQEKVLNQSYSIDPNNPVRVHRELPQAGAEEFENTIEKGAQIIRKFPNSKWTDNALFLMGKSYFYRKEYYLGLQKFEELYEVTTDHTLKQKAVIWKGQTLLELRQYGEGISFLGESLSVLEGSWNPSSKAEVQVLIAEHHAMLGNWQEALELLEPSVTKLEKRSLKMRAYFLYAQMHERQENYDQAYLVFDRVTSIYTDYQYSFWAELFKGKIARTVGNLDQSYYIFNSMSKDDKNFDRMDRVNYQIAETEQARGNVESSETRYKRLLHSTINQPGPEVRSKTYYQLGRIYSEYYNDYETAAAYFDSSSTVTVPQEDFQDEVAGSLASAYGSYASLKSQSQNVDSLLGLGNLSRQELNARLSIIRQMRINEIAENRQSSQNTISNISQENIQSEGGSGRGSNYGFLNYRNPQLASAASNDFRVIWGSRPLMDNWRRAEAIQGAVNNQPNAEIGNGNDASFSRGYSDKDLGIDTSEIPRTPEEKRQLNEDKINIQYQLGNLFFLTLNMPDSAQVYFFKVIESEYVDEDLLARTRYALHQVYKSKDNVAAADELAQEILDDHAGTIYANRIEEQMEQIDSSEIERDSTKKLLQKFKNIEESGDSLIVKAGKYRTLALANASNKLAPHVHYRALQEYLERAKDSTDTNIYNQYWIGDSTEVPSANKNPFKGAYWDSVRILVDEHMTQFEAQLYKDKLSKLNQTLEINASQNSIPTCSEVGVEAAVKPDMASFLKAVELPNELHNQRLSGSISYLITISRMGQMEEFQLESTGIPQSLEQAYSTAIRDHLEFYPFEFESEIQKVQCSVSFPVKN